MKNHAHVCFEFAVLAGVFAIAMSARAETLLWYRFDGDGATIENKAAPGTMDGTLKSINTWGSLGGLGDTAAKFPTRGDAFPEGNTLIDPATDTIYPETVKSLAFSGDPANSGVVLLPKANTTAALKEMMSFTCEAFFRLPSDSSAIETRRAKDILFPLVEWGSPTDTKRYGWFFGLRKDSSTTGFYPFFRYRYYNGTSDIQSDCQDYTYLTDSNWHHLAVVVTADTSANTATVKLVLDYTTLAATKTLSDFHGFHYNNAGSFPFLVGADLWRVSNGAKSCCFMGAIAEVRVSDTALASNKLLRPLPAGPVDADTLVYLPMGDSGWFGSRNASNYKNIYHGALNAAPTAAWSPEWVRGTESAAYPDVADGAAGETVRGGYLSTDSFADASSMSFSRASVSGAYQGHALQVPYDNMALADGDFTLEWFFKTDGQVPSGSGNNSMTFMYPSFAKIMINQADGKLKTRLIPQTGSYFDCDSAERVDDGAWHHYALVYDKKQGAYSIFLDYRLVGSGSVTLATGTSRDFFFGAETLESQAFAGKLDDFRITRRALKAGELLTTRALGTEDAALFAHFEGDLSTGQDAAVAPAGTGTNATFVPQSRIYDLDGDERADLTSEKALSLSSGSVVFPHNALLECRDFTLEWFAKYDTVPNGAMLARFNMGEGTSGTISWALYYPGKALRLGANVSADGAWKSISRADKDFAENYEIADGKWHHWALVADTDDTAAKTTFALYRDREQIGDALVFDGILALPSTGTTFSFGTGGGITGFVDELRMTPSVLAPEKFMRRITSGLVIVLR